MKNKPHLDFEIQAGYPHVLVAGVDEVGRGCLAGPVVAGAVILPPVIDYAAHPWLAEIGDSKLLKPATRERLEPLIREWAVAASVGMASVEEIDQINIYHAAHLAMRRAVVGLSTKPQQILIDGNALPKELPSPARAIVKGDMQCLSIAAASVIAKVWRDRLLGELEAKFPGYGLGGHKGYATPVHLKALRELGPCEIHRRTFAPISGMIEKSPILKNY